MLADTDGGLVKGQFRMLAKGASGTLPFPDAPAAIGTPPSKAHHSAITRDSAVSDSWTYQQRAWPIFVLELTRDAVVAMRPSILARTVYAVVAFGALFAGFGISVAIITVGHVTADNTSIIAGMGVVGCVPATFLAGVFGGRGLLKIRPRAPGVPAKVTAVDLGALFQTADLVSPRGLVSARILSRRKSFVEALRVTGQMPPAERVSESGPFA